ncbi:uncharacterized protein [Chelonus insularis]|uniref:uncharacterized protein n=1 Tax=Chelonus insularis TaxID=460826 RepID=UPI0015897BCE|nr:uncharacterized protein LOC118071072 [Chelonus insularis]
MRASHVHRRIDEQQHHHEFITSVRSKVLSIQEDHLSQQGISSWLEELQDQWQQFSTKHSAINLAMSRVDTFDERRLRKRSYFKKEIFNQTRDTYLDTVMRLTALSDNLANKNSSRASSPNRSLASMSAGFRCARLPRLELPKFDGTLSKWLSFKGIFSSVVINDSSIPPEVKLQYLKSCLTGSAGQILENTELVADNFQPSWDAVVLRHENPRLLIHSSLASLFATKRITKECGIELEKLYNSITQEIRTLKMLKQPIDHWDSLLVFLTVQRLDPESVKAWEQKLGSSKNPPMWLQLQIFLETRIQTLKAYEHSQSGKSMPNSRQPSARVHFSGRNNESSPNEKDKCVLCGEEHYLARCPRYQQMTTPQRRDAINKHRLCYNCLKSHVVSKCRSSQRCLKCAKAHHTSLHIYGSAKAKEPATTAAAATEDPSKLVNHAQFSSTVRQAVLLPTAIVNIKNRFGNYLQARVLLDQGSEISLVTENLVQQLQIPRQSGSLSLNMINNKTSKSRGLAVLHLNPYFSSSFELTVHALILPKLTGILPSEPSNPKQWPHLQELTLADPFFYKPGSIDIIIGSDLYGELLRGPIIKGPIKAPVAQLTSLGWVISGPSSSDNCSHHPKTYDYAIDEDLHSALERFWRQEEISPTGSKSLSTADQECEEHFKATHQRDPSGRYIVKLPFKNNKSQLGDSTSSAFRMLQSLHRKFESNPDFHQSYKSFLQEYKQLGHMVEVVDTEKTSHPVFYLPHHGVIRETSSTTKLRVVFNGSCRTSNGIPLNQTLHTGSKLQIDLNDVLINFRKFKYVFSADIEKMYRQIQVHPEDWDYQRILWKEDNQLIKYQLTTVTYGLACAPFLALRAITQLIEDEGPRFPRAINALTEGRYVDDIFGGSDTIEEAQQTADQVKNMCMTGGFPLRKWVSNEESVLDRIPPEHKLSTSTLKLADNTIHALGLLWNSQSDCFRFEAPSQLQTSTKTTKRSILSKIAQFFDPLGFLSPVFIQFKVFMQELWAIKLSWDDQLGESQIKTWQSLLQSLEGIPHLTIPRWIGTTQDSSVEIHGFCDASQSAMAAAVYIRVSSLSHEVTTSLLCSKTKVAPLKRMTIPRLELSSAVILTRLVSHCLKTLKIYQIPCYLWTDSLIVQTWLNEHPSKWKDFVHNRVCFIQDTLPTAQWRHVPGKVNPADCATRGLSAKELCEHEIWWTGPTWLIEDSSNWPSTRPARVDNPDELECRPIRIQTSQVIRNDLLARYSSLTRLIRVTAVCHRALLRFRHHGESLLNEPLSPEELDNATRYWIKHEQTAYFGGEIDKLSSHKELSKSSPLLKLTPFFDKTGLLRVGGRLKNSLLPTNTKHPFILPRSSHLTTLLIHDAHMKTLHGSTQETLVYLRSKYWIIGGRSPVRSFILKCVKCTRFRRSQAQQLMGQLPASRVTPSRAFLHTGIDYAGPLVLKAWKGRTNKHHKSWIAVFVCLATSAIHLEVVSDYTTDAFLAAYRRFVSRRGICATLNSDCGTTFKGAEKALKQLFTVASTELQHIPQSNRSRSQFPPSMPTN